MQMCTAVLTRRLLQLHMQCIGQAWVRLLEAMRAQAIAAAGVLEGVPPITVVGVQRGVELHWSICSFGMLCALSGLM